MIILHTSDWHLGRNLEGHSRMAEQREFIEELSTIVENNKVNLVLVAGDVFDTYNPPAEAEQLFYDALVRLAGNGKRAVIVISGNHDSPDRLHASNPLAYRQGIFLAGYPGENIYEKTAKKYTGAAAVSEYASDVSKVEIMNGGAGWLEIKIPDCPENAVVAFLPYPSEQRLNEVLAETLEDREMQKAYSARVAAALQQAAENFRDDTVNLVVSHLYVLGGRSADSEREIQLGGAYAVEPSVFPEKAHYVALGHLHRPQIVRGTSVLCRYSGSPLCYSFSEADQQKEVVILEAKPGYETVVKPVKLSCGKPMRCMRFSSYEEAYNWCGHEENQQNWVDMEIKSPDPLTGIQVSDLKKLHQGVINIRVILPGLIEATNNINLSELSMEEKFRHFVARETGADPEQELVELFLKLLEGGE